MIVGYYKICLYTTDISSALEKKKKKGVPVYGFAPLNRSDSPIGSDRDRGRDSLASYNPIEAQKRN